MRLKRTHNCCELTIDDVDKSVVLAGWVNTRRDHGGVIFIDLRDRYGLTQIVFRPEHNAEVHHAAEALRSEYVIAVRGTVAARIEGMANPKLATGEIEILVDEMELLNPAETPPFEIDDYVNVGEDLRLKYRYIDLRRTTMRDNLLFRHEMFKIIRRYLDGRGFADVETPVLTKSTPEGARDYVVPARQSPGTFYALPQSPQLFKQILMISGFDKYYQIVKCFRDEDTRRDRQAEFTQLDIEMSFVDIDDVLELIEGLLAAVFDGLMNVRIETPFPRISYGDAMSRFGCDSPDIRFGMELHDVTEIAKKGDFKVFNSADMIRGINAKGAADRYSRKDIDDLSAFIGEYGAKGMAWFKVVDGKPASSISKFFDEETQQQMMAAMEAEDGDLLMFVADEESVVCASLAALRLRLADELGLIAPDTFSFCWVLDFPLVEWNEDEGRWDSIHHPFTSPVLDQVDLMETDPGRVKSLAYDVVLNGIEIGGGSIRIHTSELQQKVFSLLGISREEARVKFGFLLDAFKYGAPPHGGIALGLDRFVRLLRKTETIRDVMAFPKTQRGLCLMTGAPSEISQRQKRELGLRLVGDEAEE